MPSYPSMTEVWRWVFIVSLFQCGPRCRQFRSLPLSTVLIMVQNSSVHVPNATSYLQSVLCVCFRKSPRPKPFIYQYVWFTRKWTSVRNTFLWIASQEKTRLHKQRQLRTVMFYSDGQTLLLESSRKLFSDDTRDTLRTKQWNSSDLPASFVFPLTSFSRLLVSSSNVQT